MQVSLMVTGHRKLIPVGYTGNPWPTGNLQDPVDDHQYTIWNALCDVCNRFIEGNKQHTNEFSFINGMALGADQLFASASIATKKSIGDKFNISLIAAVPFKGQESTWPVHKQQLFNELLAQMDDVTYVSEGGYEAWKMQVRNVWMVDRATTVLAVWDGALKGGTYNCIKYAIKQNKLIFQFNPETLEFTQFNY